MVFPVRCPDSRLHFVVRLGLKLRVGAKPVVVFGTNALAITGVTQGKLGCFNGPCVALRGGVDTVHKPGSNKHSPRLD